MGLRVTCQSVLGPSTNMLSLTRPLPLLACTPPCLVTFPARRLHLCAPAASFATHSCLGVWIMSCDAIRALSVSTKHAMQMRRDKYRAQLTFVSLMPCGGAGASVRALSSSPPATYVSMQVVLDALLGGVEVLHDLQRASPAVSEQAKPRTRACCRPARRVRAVPRARASCMVCIAAVSLVRKLRTRRSSAGYSKACGERRTHE